MFKQGSNLLKGLVLFTCLAGVATAQSQPPGPRSDTQSWNEVELSVPLNKSVDLLLLGELRVGRNLSRPVDERAGVGFTFKVNKYLELSPRYRYIAAQPFAGRSAHENRLTFATTVSVPVKGFTFSDRNQLDRRLRSSGDTTQYRNRLRIEHPVSLGGTKLKLFASDEVSYDLRERAWIRNRFSVGAGKKFSERFNGELYYSRQNDGFSRPGDLHVIGTSLKVRIK